MSESGEDDFPASASESSSGEADEHKDNTSGTAPAAQPAQPLVKSASFSSTAVGQIVTKSPPPKKKQPSSNAKKPAVSGLKGGSELSGPEQDFVDAFFQPLAGEKANFALWADIAHVSGTPSPGLVLAKQKWQRRILAVGNFRVLIVSKSKLRGKSVESSPHLFEVSVLAGLDGSIDAKAKKTKKPVSGANVLRMTVGRSEDSSKQKTYLINSPQVDRLMFEIRTSYARCSGHFAERDYVHPFSMLVNVPQDRLKPHGATDEEMTGALGFINTYLAVCNFRGDKFGTGFPRFIEDLMNRNTRVLPLTLCPGIDQDSEVALATGSVLQSLAFDPYFRGIVMRRVTLAGSLMPELCLRFNTSITKLVLTGIDGDVNWVGLSRALCKNPDHQIQIFEVSNNPLTHKDVQALAIAISSFTHSLPVLRMASCRLKPKSIEELMSALKHNYPMSLTIRELDLGHNEFKTEGTHALASWLKHAREFSQLQRLLLCATDLEIGALKGANLGQLLSLSLLDLSRNELRGPLDIDVLMTAMEQSFSLNKIDLSGCRGLSGPGVSKLMSTVLQNSNVHDIELDFSRIALGKDAHSSAEAVAGPLRTLADKMYSLKKLDFSNCKLGAEGVALLLKALGEHCMTLADLSIGGNVHDSKNAEECQMFADSLVTFFENGSGVTKLGLNTNTTSQIGTALATFFRYLGRDQGLQELNFSGNRCGDFAFLTLTDALVDNTKLYKLTIDKNNLGYNSFLALRQLLERNRVIRELDHPSGDLGAVRVKFQKSPRLLELRDCLFAFESRVTENMANFNLMNVNPDDFGDIPYEADPELDVDVRLATIRLMASWWPKAADKDDAEPPAKAAPLDDLPAHLVDGVVEEPHAAAAGAASPQSHPKLAKRDRTVTQMFDNIEQDPSERPSKDKRKDKGSPSKSGSTGKKAGKAQSEQPEPKGEQDAVEKEIDDAAPAKVDKKDSTLRERKHRRHEKRDTNTSRGKSINTSTSTKRRTKRPSGDDVGPPPSRQAPAAPRTDVLADLNALASLADDVDLDQFGKESEDDSGITTPDEVPQQISSDSDSYVSEESAGNVSVPSDDGWSGGSDDEQPPVPDFPQ